MLDILGSPKRLCNGLTRRDFIQAGSLGLMGLTLPDLLRANATASPSPLVRPNAIDSFCRVAILRGHWQSNLNGSHPNACHSPVAGPNP